MKERRRETAELTHQASDKCFAASSHLYVYSNKKYLHFQPTNKERINSQNETLYATAVYKEGEGGRCALKNYYAPYKMD